MSYVSVLSGFLKNNFWQDAILSLKKESLSALFHMKSFPGLRGIRNYNDFWGS